MEVNLKNLERVLNAAEVISIAERAEIQNITVSELLRREVRIMERLAMINLHQ